MAMLGMRFIELLMTEFDRETRMVFLRAHLELMKVVNRPEYELLKKWVQSALPDAQRRVRGEPVPELAESSDEETDAAWAELAKRMGQGS